MKNPSVTIIAGPCSIDKTNQDQLFDIAKIVVRGSKGIQRVVWGVRVVGLKSRTSLNQIGDGMGLDFPIYMKNLELYLQGEGNDKFDIPPSVHLAKRLIDETGVVVATEIVDPTLQLPTYERIIPRRKLFVWNPSVNQLGYQTMISSKYTARNEWCLGIKNGKWLGETSDMDETTMEKSWSGLVSYAENFRERGVLIHRGVDVPGKGDYRNLPVHMSAQRVKEKLSTRLYFDPSHSFGPLLRHKIVEQTVNALGIKTTNGDYLYDGLLIEVGISTTDTEQHISISEFQDLCNRISTFRDIESPETR